MLSWCRTGRRLSRRLERPHEVAGQRQPTAVTSRRILILDDNADAANSLALVLGLDGHATQAVYSAAEALSRANDFKPQVVLPDIGLPEMDGYPVARPLRAYPGLGESGLRRSPATGSPMTSSAPGKSASTTTRPSRATSPPWPGRWKLGPDETAARRALSP